MAPLPRKKTAKLRLPITESTDVSAIKSNQIDWDDENNVVFFEEVDLGSADAEKLQQLMSNRAEDYEERRRRLDPSGFAAFGALSDALDSHMPAVHARLSSERNGCLFLAIRIPDLLWHDAFTHAVKTVVAALAMGGPTVESDVHITVPEFNRWSGGASAFPIEQVSQQLRTRHVAIMHADHDLPPSVLRMLDVSLDLGTMSPDYLKAAVARYFKVKRPVVGSWAGLR